MNRYFYLDQGAVKGPIEKDEFLKLIETKKIAGLDLVYREPEKEWKPLLEYPELVAWMEGQRSPPEAPKSPEWILLKVIDRSQKPYVTKQSGPYEAHIIQNMLNRGEIEFTDYLWTEGFSKWKKIAEIEAFAPQKQRYNFSTESPLFDSKLIHEIPVESLLAEVKLEARSIPEELLPEEGLVEVDEVQKEIDEGSKQPSKIEATTSPLIRHREESKKKPIAQSSPNPARKRSVESPEATLRFRLMQGLFAAFLMGSILGIAIYLSHPTEFVRIFNAFVPSDSRSKTVVPTPEPEQPVQKTLEVAKEPEPVQVPVPVVVPSPSPSPVKVEPPAPAPPPRIFATRVQLKAQDLAGKNPAFKIETDASYHAKAILRLVGRAGQILNRRTYERDWELSFQEGQERLVPLNHLRLGDGWYTLAIELDGKKSTTTFFLGEKAQFKTKMRKHRKNLAFVHQKEKEELFQIQSEISQFVLKNQKSSQISPHDLNQIQRLLGTISRKNKVKNDLLWPEEWKELEEILKSIKTNQKVGSPTQIQKLRSRIQGLQI